MFYGNQLWVGTYGEQKISILPQMANRHGLIAGATGTGKTVTLKVLAESFSDMGVPVFLADVKGDLAGMCCPGTDSPDMQERIQKFGLKEAGFQYKAYPVCFWDIFGKMGLPLRTTVTEMGPMLLARLMDLNTTQSDILSIVFKIADDEGLLLLDIKDLRAMLNYVAENNKEYSSRYGNMAKQSLNAMLRSLVALEEQGGEQFFGEPALDIRDWFQIKPGVSSDGFSYQNSGQGVINILYSESLIHYPMMYSTFMLWMLSELFEIMPEAGDREKPKMVFFFDEAHLLFKGAPKALLQKIEQVVKLIRSKGVGIYFISQSPGDIPDEVLGQLGNKIQHGLRAYTPAEQRAIKAAADSFRINPEFDTKEVLTQLGIGEALISVLQEDGTPSVVQRVNILPPQSLMGPIEETMRQKEVTDNYLYIKYGTMIDRDSAYEFFQRKLEQQTKEERQRKEEEERQKAEEKAAREAEKEAERQARAEAREAEKKAKEEAKEKEAAGKARKRAVSSVAKSAGGTIGREVGNEIGKSIGGSFGKKLGGNLGASIGRGILGTLFGK